MNLTARMRVKFSIVSVIVTLSVTTISLLIFLALSTMNNTKAIAAPGTRAIPVGSFIINMGSNPATMNASLRPYGMIYDLIVNYNVPIVWSIDPAKTKDARDFQYLGSNYAGGTFIVESTFINAAVSARITYWQTQGIIGLYTSSALSVPHYADLTSFPVVMIDNLAGLDSILVAYYNNAAIPATSYTIGNPSQLTACYDLWANPHADPTYATHGYLRNFVINNKGYIFAQCHSVSMFESLINPSAPFDTLNFLSTQGLQCYGKNKCLPITEEHAKPPTGPYTEFFPTDPVMQYVGNLYNAYINNGSEKWFIPVSTGQWRGTTKRLLTTSDGTSPKEGVLATYGPAFGNASNGYVMWAGGHDWGVGSGAHFINAQRVFFNYTLLAAKARALAITANYPPTITQGVTYALTANVTTGTPPYTYQWLSSGGGTFSAPTSANTNFTAPGVPANTDINLRVVVTDACGRKNISNSNVTILFNSPLPVTLTSFTADNNRNSIDLKWTTASESNNDYFSIEKSDDGKEFVEIGFVKGSGNSTSTKKYSYTDFNPKFPHNFYRLRQVDFDGQFDYSKVVLVKRAKQSKLLLFPNPARVGELKLKAETLEGAYEIQVSSTTGKILITQKGIIKNDDLSPIAVDPDEKLNPGIYFVRFTSKQTDEVQKVVIQ